MFVADPNCLPLTVRHSLFKKTFCGKKLVHLAQKDSVGRETSVLNKIAHLSNDGSLGDLLVRLYLYGDGVSLAVEDGRVVVLVRHHHRQQGRRLLGRRPQIRHLHNQGVVGPGKRRYNLTFAAKIREFTS